MSRTSRVLVASLIATFVAWWFWSMPFAPRVAVDAINTGFMAKVEFVFIWVTSMVFTLRIIKLVREDN